MNLEIDHQLQAWMDDWRAATEAVSRPQPAQEIRALVRRRHHQLVAWLAVEIFIGCGFLALVIRRAVTETDPFEELAMGLLSLVIVTVMAFEAWNWQGGFRASAETTSAYLALSLDRSRRMKRGIQAGWALLIGEVAVFTPWIWYQLHGGDAAPSLDHAVFAWSFLACMVTLGILFLIVSHRWIRDDAQRLEGLRKELSDEEIAPRSGARKSRGPS